MPGASSKQPEELSCRALLSFLPLRHSLPLPGPSCSRISNHLLHPIKLPICTHARQRAHQYHLLWLLQHSASPKCDAEAGHRLISNSSSRTPLFLSVDLAADGAPEAEAEAEASY